MIRRDRKRLLQRSGRRSHPQDVIQRRRVRVVVTPQHARVNNDMTSLQVGPGVWGNQHTAAVGAKHTPKLDPWIPRDASPVCGTEDGQTTASRAHAQPSKRQRMAADSGCPAQDAQRTHIPSRIQWSRRLSAANSTFTRTCPSAATGHSCDLNFNWYRLSDEETCSSVNTQPSVRDARPLAPDAILAGAAAALL